jgi:hypothetical protein
LVSQEFPTINFAESSDINGLLAKIFGFSLLPTDREASTKRANGEPNYTAVSCFWRAIYLAPPIGGFDLDWYARGCPAC